MDNNINSGVTFQAKLVTNLKGRNNIMKPVAKEFEKMTKKIPGELYVERYIDDYAKHCAEMEYEGADWITSRLFPLLSKESANPKDIAKKLSGQLRAMKAVASYREKSAPIMDSIYTLESSVKRAEHKLDRANRLGLNEVAERVTDVIKDYEKQIAELKEKLKPLQESTWKKIDKYNDKGINVHEYRDYIADAFEHFEI